jgi:hypothetical protein
MNQRHCLDLAGRIDAALLRELGEGIDLARTLNEPLYQRDVLLVCDGFESGELPKLAQELRAALADAPADAAAGESSGFHAPRFLNSLFGALGVSTATPPQAAAPKGRQRGGFGRLRR